MAKQTGLGARLFLDEFDISNDVGSVGSISKSINVLELTGLDKLAPERQAGLRNAQITNSPFWNPTNAHLAMRNRGNPDRLVSYFHRATLGAPVASMVSKQVTYDASRGSDGAFTASHDSLSNAWWMDWGLALTAGRRTDTVATNGTGVDFQIQGAPLSFGLQAYVHVFAFTGTNVTFTVQSSSDNGGGDPYSAVTGGAFTAMTGVGFQRIQTARNLPIERYLRVVTTGTFSNVIFAVQATVNQTTVDN